MLEGSKAVSQFIDTIIDAKMQGTEMEPDVRERLHKNLQERLEFQLIQKIVSMLDPHEQLEVEHLINSHQTDKIQEYLTTHGVNLNMLVGNVMADFQATFLGA